MNVFVDTSAVYAVFDRDDQNHATAAQRWGLLLQGDAQLVTHNYVVLELTTLLQHRLGMEAVRDLVVDVLPACAVHWVTDAVHAQAVHWLLGSNRRRLSLTDCVSFEVMHRTGCSHAFAFDAHFQAAGFAEWK